MKKMRFDLNGLIHHKDVESDYDTAIDMTTSVTVIDEAHLIHESGIRLNIFRKEETNSSSNAPGYEEGDGLVEWENKSPTITAFSIELALPFMPEVVPIEDFKDALMHMKSMDPEKFLLEDRYSKIMSLMSYGDAPFSPCLDRYDEFSCEFVGAPNPPMNGQNAIKTDALTKGELGVMAQALFTQIDSRSRLSNRLESVSMDLPADLARLIEANAPEAIKRIELQSKIGLSNRCNYANAEVYMKIQEVIERAEPKTVKTSTPSLG